MSEPSEDQIIGLAQAMYRARPKNYPGEPPWHWVWLGDLDQMIWLRKAYYHLTEGA